jgi:hypothetical protein
VLRTIESDRSVTGVTWVDGELWHGTWEDSGAISAASTRKRVKCSSDWTCRLELPSPGSNPMAGTVFSAEAGAAK